MIKDKSIFIKNIYYMLSYAFTTLNQGGYEDVAMQMLGAALQAHKVIYNNNPVLKWCLTNTGVQTDRNGNIVPIKNQSPKQRIDRNGGIA